MRNAIVLGTAALAAAFALPAHAWGHHGAAGWRHHAAAGDHMAHAAALDPSDQALAQRIADEIAADPAVSNTPVTVAVNDGKVALAGPTDNAATVAHIEADAARIAGRANVAPMV